jgi:hypothetical protein
VASPLARMTYSVSTAVIAPEGCGLLLADHRVASLPFSQLEGSSLAVSDWQAELTE